MSDTNYGPATQRYQKACREASPRRVFLDQLPANTKLGKAVAGLAGSRLYTGGDHQLAPGDVQREMGNIAAEFAQDVEDEKHPYKATVRETVKEVGSALDTVTQPILEATGLDHGALGAASKLLGVPVSVLFVVLLIVLYLVLRNFKVVPPIKEVVS